MMNNVTKLASALPEGVDAAIFTDPGDRFWLTGFSTSAGAVVVGRQRSRFFTDFRYIESARAKVTSCEVEQSLKLNEQLAAFLSEIGAKRIILRDDRTTVRQARDYEKALSEFKPEFSAELAAIMERAVMLKDTWELEIMRQAQKITDEGWAAGIKHIKPGMTERELTAILENEMKQRGAEGFSFDFIVVSGEKSSLPHGVPGDEKIQNNAFLTMDIGVKYKGYCSDMTRTVCVGKPNDEMVKVYDTVLKAQLMALEAIAPGKRCCDIDRISRDFIYESGYEGCFGHGLGHSLGVNIHENPRFSPGCETVLEPGMVLSVEPGIYLEGRFGVRIEDVIIVTENGCEDITGSPKQLICI